MGGAEPLALAAPMGAAAVPLRNPAFAGMGVGDVVVGADVVPPSPPAAARKAVADVVAPLWPPTASPWPPLSAPLSPGPPRSGPVAPLKSTTTTGGLPSGVCMAPKLMISSSAS